MSANDPRLLAKHVRKISRYEGITEGQASVLRAAADALEAVQDWKAQAMTVLAEWEATFEAAGSPGRLGQSKAVALREEVERLRALSAHPADLDRGEVEAAARDEVIEVLIAESRNDHDFDPEYDYTEDATRQADALLASGVIMERSEVEAAALEAAAVRVDRYDWSQYFMMTPGALLRVEAARLRSGKDEA